jgi:alpha,alpha-trehalase
MKYVLFCLLWLNMQVTLWAQKPNMQTPDMIYGELFHDIQMARIFPDGKTFVDCVPKRPAKDIVADYKKIKNNPAIKFSLELFVKDNFDIPQAPQINYVTQEKDVAKHIRNLWGVLKREKDVAKHGSSLLALPNPYIVPGGRFREIYYWDSYFTMLGLKESGEVKLIESMIDNFAYLIQAYGHIPNGNRSYYITRSQPPFFSLMVELLASIKGNGVYKKYEAALKREYAYWMEGAATLKPGQAFKRVVRLKDGTLLNRYWDDAETPRQESYREDVETAEKAGGNQKLTYRNLRAGAASGWDFSSRWFADSMNINTIQTIGIVPVDLNCLIMHLEQCIMRAKGKTASKASVARGRAITHLFWNKELGYFTDINLSTGQPNTQVTAAGLFPFCFMHFGPDMMPERGKAAAAVVKVRLLQPGGLLTTPFKTGQQWDAPNGWAPLQWMGIWALNNCYQQDLAKDIATRWIQLNKDVYARTGKLMEKYNVMDTNLEAGGGEYPGQDGFGWTNGVLLALMKKYEGN